MRGKFSFTPQCEDRWSPPSLCYSGQEQRFLNRWVTTHCPGKACHCSLKGQVEEKAQMQSQYFKATRDKEVFHTYLQPVLGGGCRELPDQTFKCLKIMIRVNLHFLIAKLEVGSNLYAERSGAPHTTWRLVLTAGRAKSFLCP